MTIWQIHSDGSWFPPRGEMTIAAVLRAPDGARHTIARNIGRGGCSNEAEALALTAALEEALRLGATRAQVYCDNSVLVAETMGTKRTQIERLARVYTAARAMIDRFEQVTIQWVPRHRNVEADALIRSVLNED